MLIKYGKFFSFKSPYCRPNGGEYEYDFLPDVTPFSLV